MLDSSKVLFVAAVLASTAQAHIALWDKGLFGLNYPGQATDSVQNYNNNEPVNPLREMDALSQAQWFGHGLLGYPPAPGDYMQLPSGGTYNGELNCNRAGTSLRDPSTTGPLPYYACGGVGALHVMNRFNETVDDIWFGGSALAIAYTSNEKTVQPNDFTVISVLHNTVWTREVAYEIPAGMPPCPSGGCLCTWNWIHEADHGEGYPFEMYNQMFRCQVTGSTNSGNTVQRGAVPVDCSSSSSSCVSGPKTPFYIYQASGNNLPHLDTPPNYQPSWGFGEGAQNDIFQKASSPAPTTGLLNPYATPTGTSAGNRPTPTATALPDNWIGLGCQVDTGSPRTLPNGAYQQTNNNSYESCVEWCSAGGYKYAGVEYGNECWCANEANLQSANATDCNQPCSGDEWAYCGGSWRVNVFLNIYVPGAGGPNPTAPGSANGTGTASGIAPYPTPAVQTTGLPSGWSSLGCVVDQNSPRALNRGSQTLTNNTANSCIATCTAQGYPFAGMEYGNECWCGDVANIITAPVGDCNVQCSGNDMTYCGGSWRINIYGNGKGQTLYPSGGAPSSTSASSTSTVTASTVKTSSTSSSSATKASSTAASSSTTAKASPTAASSSTTAKASPSTATSAKTTSTAVSSTLTSSVAKVSTSTVGNVTPTPVTSTSMSSTAAVASSSAPAAAAPSLPAGWGAMGCYVDNANRVFSQYQSLGSVSASTCAAQCASKGFAYAGLEYSWQCYCGAAPAYLQPAPSTDCNMACAGDKTQTCGAAWRLSIFSSNATAVAQAKAKGLVARSLPAQAERVVRFDLGRDARRI